MARGVMRFDTKLNNLANTLMAEVPNDIKDKTDRFCKEVAKAVDSEISEMEKKVKTASEKVEDAEARLPKIGGANDESFILKDTVDTNGTFLALYRLSNKDKPLDCINYKKTPVQTAFCGEHCAGFKILKTGDVEICNGSIRKVKR